MSLKFNQWDLIILLNIPIYYPNWLSKLCHNYEYLFLIRLVRFERIAAYYYNVLHYGVYVDLFCYQQDKTSDHQYFYQEIYLSFYSIINNIIIMSNNWIQYIVRIFFSICYIWLSSALITEVNFKELTVCMFVSQRLNGSFYLCVYCHLNFGVLVCEKHHT